MKHPLLPQRKHPLLPQRKHPQLPQRKLPLLPQRKHPQLPQRKLPLLHQRRLPLLHQRKHPLLLPQKHQQQLPQRHQPLPPQKLQLRLPQGHHAPVTSASTRGKERDEAALAPSSKRHGAGPRLSRDSPCAGSVNASDPPKHARQGRCRTSTTRKSSMFKKTISLKPPTNMQISLNRSLLIVKVI